MKDTSYDQLRGNFACKLEYVSPGWWRDICLKHHAFCHCFEDIYKNLIHVARTSNEVFSCIWLGKFPCIVLKNYILDSCTTFWQTLSYEQYLTTFLEKRHMFRQASAELKRFWKIFYTRRENLVNEESICIWLTKILMKVFYKKKMETIVHFKFAKLFWRTRFLGCKHLLNSSLFCKHLLKSSLFCHLVFKIFLDRRNNFLGTSILAVGSGKFRWMDHNWLDFCVHEICNNMSCQFIHEHYSLYSPPDSFFGRNCRFSQSVISIIDHPKMPLFSKKK